MRSAAKPTEQKEFAMSKPRRSYSSRKRLLASVKIAAVVAVLGFVTVVLEQPRLTASPSNPETSVQQSPYGTDAGAAALSEPATRGGSRLPASESLPVYFPSQFAPPRGEVEPQPATF
jgi:hypothetical protein